MFLVVNYHSQTFCGLRGNYLNCGLEPSGGRSKIQAFVVYQKKKKKKIHASVHMAASKLFASLAFYPRDN